MASPGSHPAVQWSQGGVLQHNFTRTDPRKASHVKPHVMRMSSNKRLGNYTELHGIGIRWLMLAVLTTLLDP